MCRPSEKPMTLKGHDVSKKKALRSRLAGASYSGGFTPEPCRASRGGPWPPQVQCSLRAMIYKIEVSGVSATRIRSIVRALYLSRHDSSATSKVRRDHDEWQKATLSGLPREKRQFRAVYVPKDSPKEGLPRPATNTKDLSGHAGPVSPRSGGPSFRFFKPRRRRKKSNVKR